MKVYLLIERDNDGIQEIEVFESEDLALIVAAAREQEHRKHTNGYGGIGWYVEPKELQ